MRLIQKPDWDPNNPYHYHVNGQKVVVTPEDWEKYKDDPTFREVRAAVEAEQAAHPGPEYDEVENPAWRKAYQNLVNGVNLRGRNNYLQPLPQGYTRDTKGIPMDAQGNYYLPVEKATDAPYFVNQERGMMGHTVPVRYEQQQMPERTIRQLKQPLPVDKIMDVGEEKEKVIIRYINDNNKEVQMYRRPWFKSDSDPVIWVYGKNALPSTSYADGRGDSFGWHGFDIYDNDSKDAKQYSADNLITEEEFKKAVDLIPGWGTYIDVQNPNLWIDKKITRKPSRQEAEKKAVIKVGGLEKVGTFANGGRLINKYQNGGKPYQQSQPYNKTYDYFLNHPRLTSTMNTKIPSVFVSPHQRNTTVNIPYSINDQDWLKYWYKNRRKQLSNISWYPYFNNEDLENYMYADFDDIENRQIDSKVFSLNNIIDYAYSQPVKYVPLENGIRGTFYPKNKSIEIDPEQASSSTNLHEHVHKINDKMQQDDTQLIDLLNGNFIFGSPIEKQLENTYDKSSFDEYLDDPREIYSRLMEFRRMNNLNPQIIYKKEDIQKWRKNKSLEKYGLDRYSDDQLLYLFNEVADNTKQDEEINYSKRGSKLIKR